MARRQILTYLIAILIILMGVQNAVAVHYIPSDTEIGAWDNVSRTYTLTADVFEAIEIVENNLTLDGDGYTAYAGINIIEKTGITVMNFNLDGSGVFLRKSYNCLIKDNIVSNSYVYGIGISFLSDNCAVTGNTVSNCNNGIGIILASTNCIVSDNTISNNSNMGIAVVRYSDNCTVTGNIISNNDTGINIIDSDDLIIGDNNISSSYIGIFAQTSYDFKLTDNMISSNDYGLLGWASYLNLTGNTFSNNNVGVEIGISKGCQTYNNNFISNTFQCSVYSSNSSDIVFNIQTPTGGNFWSNWNSPDNDNDGFVDTPFVFEGGQDNLPWTVQDGWVTPEVRIGQLITEVESLNLQQGISNSLDSKLDAVEKALDDVNENNDGAAVNALGAFINAVEAQRGKKISEDDADALIEMAQQIIDLLSNG